MTGRVLMIGGTGFLGRNLAQALARAGMDVAITGRAGGEIPLDLADQTAVERVLNTVRPSVIVHLACGLKPGSDAAAYRRERVTLVDPTCALVLACAARGIDLIFMSSGGTVYGATERVTCREDDPLLPVSFYGQSKVELEEFIRFVARTTGLRYLILRPSNPYGPHQALDGAQGLIAVAFGRLAQGLPLDVWGDGRAVRDYLHVDDMVAVAAALIAGPTRGEAINIGSGEGHSLLAVATMIEEVSGHRLPLRFQPARASDVPRVVLDTDRFRELVDVRPRPLAEGLADYFDYLRETGQWPASR